MVPTAAGAPAAAVAEGKEVVYGVRPEHLHLREGAGDTLPAEVIVVEPTGAETLVVTQVAGGECKAVFRERHRLAPGERIALEPQLDQVHLFDRASGQRMLQ